MAHLITVDLHAVGQGFESLVAHPKHTLQAHSWHTRKVILMGFLVQKWAL
jgi:hypothetical protein